MHADSGVEALDPQSAEGALLVATVTRRILHALLDRLLGNADRILAAAVEALGCLENLLVLGVGGNAPFDAGHGKTPSKSGMWEELSQPFGRKYFSTL